MLKLDIFDFLCIILILPRRGVSDYYCEGLHFVIYIVFIISSPYMTKYRRIVSFVTLLLRFLVSSLRTQSPNRKHKVHEVKKVVSSISFAVTYFHGSVLTPRESLALEIWSVSSGHTESSLLHHAVTFSLVFLSICKCICIKNRSKGHRLIR